jgi:hypothetical protein
MIMTFTTAALYYQDGLPCNHTQRGGGGVHEKEQKMVRLILTGHRTRELEAEVKLMWFIYYLVSRQTK